MSTNELLAKDHAGMRVNGLRYLKQSSGQGYSYMRRGMAKHLEELGRRYYAGDVAVVDEFLQLYCIAETERAELIAKEARK